MQTFGPGERMAMQIALFQEREGKKPTLRQQLDMANDLIEMLEYSAGLRGNFIESRGMLTPYFDYCETHQTS